MAGKIETPERDTKTPKVSLDMRAINNVIAEVNGDAVFECEVKGDPSSSIWRKNGVPITNSQRIKATSDNNIWHRLEIKKVSAADHGLYSLHCKQNEQYQSCAAHLFVAQGKLNERVSYTPATKQGSPVRKHLRDVKCEVGNKIELDVVFKLDAVDFQYYWYRNNELLEQNNRTKILRSVNTSSLSILNCELTDTGVYTVVFPTKQGLVTSFASVLVTETDEDLALSDEDQLPILEETLPEEIEINEGEDARMLCKPLFDNNTSVQWFKNDVPLEQASKLKPTDYGDSYIGLKGMNITRADVGTYKVELHNDVTRKKEVATTILVVNSRPVKNPPIREVTRPLCSAVACCGSKVLFDCSFALFDPTYYYVVWYVGHYRVERTNSRFDVLCNGGEYLLYIKKLEPGMNGEVVCELRKHLNNQSNIIINSCSAYLTVVPTAYRDNISSLKPKLYDSSHLYDERFTSQEESDRKCLAHLFSACHCFAPRFDPNEPEMSPSGRLRPYRQIVVLEVAFCQLSYDGVYYVHTETAYKDLRLKVFPKNSRRSMFFQWEDSMRTWYEIEYMQFGTGEYTEIGETSSPSFEVGMPPAGRLMKFRVLTTTAERPCDDCSIYLVPPSDVSVRSSRNHDIQPMDKFDTQYFKTGNVIGSGAFGSVILVNNKFNELYAAKVIKTKTHKKREMAMNEYMAMKNLHHPKLVSLVDAFLEHDTFIIVMDYLWGGQLFDRIVKEDHIKEVDVIPYIIQICEALKYMHSFELAHLDIKPENIVCISPNSGQIKIIDFGMAKFLRRGNQLKAIYGTKDYVAPEVLNYEVISVACDMWSLGVVTYVMLSGLMPFAGETWCALSTNIVGVKYDYNDFAFHEVSDLAKDFVDRLLVFKPRSRMTADQALKHAWILEGPPSGFKAVHMKRAKENLKSYLANYKVRWQRAGNVMIAARRFRTQALAQPSLEEASSTSLPSENLSKIETQIESDTTTLIF